MSKDELKFPIKVDLDEVIKVINDIDDFQEDIIEGLKQHFEPRRRTAKLCRTYKANKFTVFFVTCWALFIEALTRPGGGSYYTVTREDKKYVVKTYR